MSEVLLSVDQAAEQLKLHPKTVIRYIRDWRLPAKRIGKSYRIEQARLDAFAGVAHGQAGGAVRATCVVDIPEMTVQRAERLATFLGAAAMTGGAGTPPLHLSTAFDPATGNLKVVLIGSPSDTASLLGMMELQLSRP